MEFDYVIIGAGSAGCVIANRLSSNPSVSVALIEGGLAWTHYWSGEHPAAPLFGSPVAGAGVGIYNIAFLSWYQYGAGQSANRVA